MAPDVMWLTMKGKKRLPAIKRLRFAHCEAQVRNKNGHRKVRSKGATPDSSVSTDMHSRSASSMPGSHRLGSLSEAVHGMAMVLLPFF